MVSYGHKVVWRTSLWLCNDPTYGINREMPLIVNAIHASDVMIYFHEIDLKDWEMETLNRTVDFWRGLHKTVWLEIGKTTLEEIPGTKFDVQYWIDRLNGKIAGIMFDFDVTLDPTTATNWLLVKKSQLEANGMRCIYYHGDGVASDYGNPATDVNATYLNDRGLTVCAWLQDDNSWKPVRFDFKPFWIDYDILSGTGRSYDEIYNRWYIQNVIERDNLKNNAGCKALVFAVYTKEAWPNDDALNGMRAVAMDWLGIGWHPLGSMHALTNDYYI